MVTGDTGGSTGRNPIGTRARIALAEIGAAATRFLCVLPPLLLALLCLRMAELYAGLSPGTSLVGVAGTFADALLGDLLVWARHLPPLFLVSFPLFLIPSRRAAFWAIGVAWSALVAMQAALVQYFIVARVPLGADLFAYSLSDIHETVSSGLRLTPAVVLGLWFALLCLWGMLKLQVRGERYAPPIRVTVLVFVLALAALVFAPGQLAQAGAGNQYTYNLSVNKTAFFLDDSVAYLMRSRGTDAHPGLKGDGKLGSLVAGSRYLDPRYPFLRTEQTPDELGPHFGLHPQSPPNLVFVIVEGLGRSFSGPDARLGSFTPFLDQLADRSLYWENFLAAQGRTFGVLPSVFGSLPYGEQGFNALGERMPAHTTLLSVLKSQGYRLKAYSGTDLSFDDERTFLQRQGVDLLRDSHDFGQGYPRANDWGYADNELISFALAAEARDSRQPFISILKTITTHPPYTFPGQQRYRVRFEERLAQLGVTGAERSAYRADRDIYASILYVDDSLRRYFDAVQKLPWYHNTIFIVTGDHRLPEIPMGTWIERYHVPLIIFSPLLKAPARIKSVSSHFDITPSLLAFLSHGYGLRSPSTVTWIGSGLDLEPGFRNLHNFPMKQTKTNLVDFVSGPWLLSRDKLYALDDGLQEREAHDPAALADVRARFAAFRAANSQFAQSLALVPPDAAKQLMAYDEAQRRPSEAAPDTSAASGTALAVREVRSPERAKAGKLHIEVVFANAAPQPSETFVPLIVLQTVDGRELSESYGIPVTLAAGATMKLRLAVKSAGVAAGRYFLSVFPSDPETGKRTGSGRFRIPVVISG
jgi:uncharacterized sulfatase